jgi:hypothetical protein
MTYISIHPRAPITVKMHEGSGIHWITITAGDTEFTIFGRSTPPSNPTGTDDPTIAEIAQALAEPNETIWAIKQGEKHDAEQPDTEQIENLKLHAEPPAEGWPF